MSPRTPARTRTFEPAGRARSPPNGIADDRFDDRCTPPADASYPDDNAIAGAARADSPLRPRTVTPLEPSTCPLVVQRSHNARANAGSRGCRQRTKAATGSATKTWPESVETSSRRPAAWPALGGFRSACVTSHAGDTRRRCWSGRSSTATSSDVTRRPPSWASRSTTWRVLALIRLTLADAWDELGT